MSSQLKATMKTPMKANKASGKESASTFVFSEQNWEACTRQYSVSVAKCTSAALHEIVAQATTITGAEMLYDDCSKSDDLAEESMQRINICMIRLHPQKAY